MAKKRHRRRRRSILRSRFYQIYFLLVILCVAGIVLGMRHIGALLEDYESAQPKYVAQAAASLFENADYDAIGALDTSMERISGGDRDFYVQSLRELSAGKRVTWSEVYSRSEDEKLYRVNLDGEKFAEFTLVPSGRRTPQGNRLWALGSITTYVAVAAPTATPEPTPAPVACTITVPSGSTVEVDGAVLGPENIVEDGIPTASAGMLPEGVVSPTMTRYAFFKDSGAPEIRVTGTNGRLQEPQQSGENAWFCPLIQSPELKEQYEEAVVEVAKRIARFSVKDLSQASMLKSCAKGSPAYASISDFDNKWGKQPISGRFENITTSDYYQYGGDCFSCHVEFDYVARFKKSDGDMTYPTAYTLYFIREGDGGKLYSFSFS